MIMAVLIVAIIGVILMSVAIICDSPSYDSDYNKEDDDFFGEEFYEDDD